MELILFFILCLIWPIRWFIQLFKSKKTKKNMNNEEPYKLCRKSIKHNINDQLLWASSLNYTDMWTRDTFFACMGIENTQPFIDVLAKYQRNDGLVPLYIGKGNACCKLFCNQKPTGRTKAAYCDAKTGNIPTDSCFQFIILAYNLYPNKCKQAWYFMQKFVKNDLIYENGLGTWQDTIKHKGHVAYTNILYYKATKMLFPKKSNRIKEKLIEKLWNGMFFECSTTNKSFGQVDNALAILYDVAPTPNTIFEIHARYFNSVYDSPNKLIRNNQTYPAFQWYEVYLPCYPLGNAKYHNGWAWTWVQLLFLKAKQKNLKQINIEFYITILRDYGSIYETFDKNGPIKRLLYNSQPDFSEACGIFLDLIGKKIV